MDTNATLPEARELYSRWRETQATWEAQRAKLSEKLEGIGQMIDGLLKVHPELREQRQQRAPVHHEVAPIVVSAPKGTARANAEVRRGGRLTSAILDAVRDVDGQWVTVKDVMATLEAQDALPEGEHRESTVRSLLRRAHQDGLLEKDQVDGRTTKYRLARPTDAESPAATGLSATPDPVLAVEGGEGDGTEAASDHQDHVSGRHDGNHRDPSVVVEG